MTGQGRPGRPAHQGLDVWRGGAGRFRGHAAAGSLWRPLHRLRQDHLGDLHDHFWDPLDKKYIDFDEPFDLENEALLPEEQVPVLRLPYVNETLSDPKQRTAFINHLQLWNFSSILHGEQGALNLSASLCHVLYDQGAQEYAANQTREEARHVTAFARYIKSRWGTPGRPAARR